MLSRALFLCLLVAVFSTGSSLRCQATGWKNEFRRCSENCLNLLDAMASNNTEDAEKAHVTFPNDLYRQMSKASAEDKVGFTVQVLEEVAALFEEDHSSATWERFRAENFLSVVTRQAEGLSSCIRKQEKKSELHKHFKRLSHLLEQRGHGAQSWELIRRTIRRHLQRVDLLVSSFLAADNSP